MGKIRAMGIGFEDRSTQKSGQGSADGGSLPVTAAQNFRFKAVARFRDAIAAAEASLTSLKQLMPDAQQGCVTSYGLARAGSITALAALLIPYKEFFTGNGQDDSQHEPSESVMIPTAAFEKLFATLCDSKASNSKPNTPLDNTLSAEELASIEKCLTTILSSLNPVFKNTSSGTSTLAD